MSKEFIEILKFETIELNEDGTSEVVDRGSICGVLEHPDADASKVNR